MDWEGFEPSQEVCRTSMLPVNITNPNITKKIPTVRFELTNHGF